MSDHGHDSEKTALDAIVDRLAVELLHVPAEQIVRRVDEEHRRYDGSPIRDFVPILVERAAKSALTGR